MKEEGLLNITTMSNSMWYRVLLEDFVTHTTDNNGIREYRPCRIESKFPEVDWVNTWSLAVTPGLSSDLTSFLWLMIHHLLPTRERLHRMNMPGTNSPICDLCDLQAVDNLEHALLQCPSSRPSATLLYSAVQSILPDIQLSQVLLLDFRADCEYNLPLTFLIGSVLSLIWVSRKNKKTLSALNTRASLEAGIQILRKSRHHESAEKIDELLIQVDQ